MCFWRQNYGLNWKNSSPLTFCFFWRAWSPQLHGFWGLMFNTVCGFSVTYHRLSLYSVVVCVIEDRNNGNHQSCHWILLLFWQRDNGEYAGLKCLFMPQTGNFPHTVDALFFTAFSGVSLSYWDIFWYKVDENWRKGLKMHVFWDFLGENMAYICPVLCFYEK